MFVAKGVWVWEVSAQRCEGVLIDIYTGEKGNLVGEKVFELYIRWKVWYQYWLIPARVYNQWEYTCTHVYSKGS